MEEKEEVNYEKIKLMAFEMIKFCEFVVEDLLYFNKFEIENFKNILKNLQNQKKMIEEKKTSIKIVFFGKINSGKSTLISSMINNAPPQTPKDCYLPVYPNQETLFSHEVKLIPQNEIQSNEIKFYTIDKNKNLITNTVFENIYEARDHIKRKHSKKSFEEEIKIQNSYNNIEIDNDIEYYSEMSSLNELLNYSNGYPITLIDTPGLTEKFSKNLEKKFFGSETILKILLITYDAGLEKFLLDMLFEKKNLISNLIIVVTKVNNSLGEYDDDEKIELIEDFEKKILINFKDKKIDNVPPIIYYDRTKKDLNKIYETISKKMIMNLEKYIILKDFKDIPELIKKFKNEISKLYETEKIKENKRNLQKNLKIDIKDLKIGILSKIQEFFEITAENFEFEKIVRISFLSTKKMLLNHNYCGSKSNSYLILNRYFKKFLTIEVQNVLRNMFKNFTKLITSNLIKKLNLMEKSEKEIFEENLNLYLIKNIIFCDDNLFHAYNFAFPYLKLIINPFNCLNKNFTFSLEFFEEFRENIIEQFLKYSNEICEITKDYAIEKIPIIEETFQDIISDLFIEAESNIQNTMSQIKNSLNKLLIILSNFQELI